VTDGTPHADARRRAGWLPGDQEGLETWLSHLVERADTRGEETTLHPVLVQFQTLIATDALVRMQLERMLEEVPQAKPYSRRYVRDVDHLLRLLDEVLTTAPEFSGDSMVITPVAAVLDWAMGTPSGFAAFRNPTVNAMLKKVLTAWCEFLDSPDSLYVLNDSPAGWTGEAARTAIGIDQYEHDPDDEHWGFASWNDFFTRRFREGERPVASPEDDAVIVSACESTPYALARDVARRDRFWVKEQSYSLQDMLADDPSVGQFVGGTVYQAYLSATDYHRWHAPVGGTVVRACTVDGTYYSDADSEGADAEEPQESQGYMAHVAARAIILIEADDPRIGLVAFVPVGMADVSSCLVDPDVTPGRRVTKGQELGRFQFGGSTYCLIFRPGVLTDVAFQAVPQPHDPDAPLVHVNSRIATAR